MEANLKKLADLLAAEYKLYQEVYQLAKEKQEVIMNDKLDKLEEIIKQEEEYLQTVQKLENTREQLVGEKNISQVMANAKEPMRSRLDNLQDKLLKMTMKLQDLNQLNGKLLEDALQLANINLSILGVNQQNNTYSRQGSVNQNQNGGSMLNHKA
ncbi:flagellar biosynthesis/type III secretory pathway chaperone [Halobacteroides halobius DSM 5150]|uniref:Flagellar biosynthesis/type III secretory pathway chaperone n=1 Tax=Halobacteroides halobius (strain ATCC 35273 / DSM 5150 / MD-1) TaxID=748449 RepID=L0KAW0_HALHC|nr:flagellar protein FlgN [Halobacteroides halobius]AGB42151.1 flagellar biosynthesis/type III secretory pathway chaperone [Halobacteroides halobius DSM 5150]